ncbi:hypothetical protein WMF26_11345 [Sorangium sp. So ce185]|uniref:hypothetical protein n=1 Tax=Sorangium sp. So ce185 TaxID=3133287 RepID=UPI003F5D95EF
MIRRDPSNTKQKERLSARPEDVVNLRLRRMETPNNPEGQIPSFVTLIRSNPLDRGYDQLFIDQVPLPREAWSFDAHDRILRWTDHDGGGELHLAQRTRGAVGVLSTKAGPVSVTGGAQAQFRCAVAEKCGATYITDGDKVVGFHWDPSSAAWKNAAWVQDRLLLTYTVTQESPILPPSFTFEFADDETGDLPWDPVVGSFLASLKLGVDPQGRMIWNLVFKSEIDPPQDSGPSTGPKSVYPYWLQAIEDASASTIDGAMEINNIAPKGQLIGVQGARVLPSVSGYYQTAGDKAPFGVFHGKLHVDGQAVARCRADADTLYWQGLSPEHQERLGLPERGSLRFASHGGSAESPEGLGAQRLDAAQTLRALGEHRDLHPRVLRAAQSHAGAMADLNLTIQGLLAMTPFGQNDKGAWEDVVQKAVRDDLGTIMNSFVPDSIWQLLFPSTPKPTLNAELTRVAHTPVKGVDDPVSWYQSLGTAVMTQGMSGGSNENCKNMNGPRAGAWLQQEVANAPVYQAHSQLLFTYRWAQRNPLINDYLADQIDNAGAYEPTIDAQVKLSVQDIERNVVANDASPADMKQKLEDQVGEAGLYAKTNKLYWAFAYYTWNTAPAILANIAIQLGVNTGSTDGTTLTRLFQQNITVLTALDPSGYFARKYNEAINTFMCTNILPSMYGFTGDADDFNLFKEYLQEFVKQNINSENKDIAAAAVQIQAILDEEDADEILKNSLAALRTIAESIDEALALPYVANRFVKWFETNYPRLSKYSSVFGTMVLTGLNMLAVFNMIREYKQWDKLDAGQKAELILETCQFGLQMISAVVTRGVRVYAIYSAEGLTTYQRFASIFKVIGSGEAETAVMNDAMMQVSNNMARWIGDTAGSYAEREAMARLARVGLFGEDEAAQVSWTTKIFGRNLDEFIATRVGPVLILAGMGLSIYFIATGESGLALGADICNLVSGALSLFAVVGGWFIVEGATGVFATMVAVAGPLAIIAALVGVALMIWEMFQTPPDPVKQFVDDYVRPAGFYVATQCGAIDYATSYARSGTHLLMMGFQLTVGAQALLANGDGTIALGTPNYMPSCVWASAADGFGLTQICAQVQPAQGKAPVSLLLSLMSDNSVSFQPKVTKANPPRSSGGPTVTTQMWLCNTAGGVTTTQTDNGATALASMQIYLQPVLPDANGDYSPSQASGQLVLQGNTLAWSRDRATDFLLSMAGLQPNYMSMVNPRFLVNTTPSTSQSFGPNFGTYPSSPLKYTLSGSLPDFLDFDDATGKLSPNGRAASAALERPMTITATNDLGNDHADFVITVS